MLELRLESGTVVAFDGRVLEIFDAAHGSRRFHVACTPTPRLTVEEEQSRLVLDEPALTLEVARAEVPACERLIAAVAHARAGDELRSW